MLVLIFFQELFILQKSQEFMVKGWTKVEASRVKAVISTEFEHAIFFNLDVVEPA